ncbi:MAG TPA: transcription antitermination factor NusB [Gemmatimonadales bacterium]|jgi:16S rRNA (cytosine967-C5)-methyltransferase
MKADGLAARRAALRILGDVREGRPFDAALDRAVGSLMEVDRRLAHEMAAGVLRRQSALDARLGRLVPRGWESVAPGLQDVLRLGAFQLTALDRVPAHAAVDTSVSLARGMGGVRAGGFVNAVLRRLVRLPAEPPTPTDGVETAADLAERFSHPRWLVDRWVARFGTDAAAELLRWNNTRPRLVLQAAREGLEALERRWRDAGIAVEPAPFGAGLVVDRSRPSELPGYAEGSFIVQDPAQALLAWFADLPPDVWLYDACAAPGGKTITLGRNVAGVVAGDLGRRIERLAANLRRAGSGREHVVVADAMRAPVRPMGAVLLDVPCLGTGTFARNPDARWRVTPEALAGLVDKQAALLARSADAVAPGGLLIYSTCSLEPEENEIQVDRWLDAHPEFVREAGDTFPSALVSPKGDLMIVPQVHRMDGAYAARLRRVR